MTSREHPTATITTPNSTPGQSGRFGSESVAAFVGMRNLRELADGFEARRVIGEWIDFYNTERPHSALGGETPAEAYRGAPPEGMWTSRYAPCPHPLRRNNNGKEIDSKGFWRHERGCPGRC